MFASKKAKYPNINKKKGKVNDLNICFMSVFTSNEGIDSGC
jgi:hypothetical protein